MMRMLGAAFNRVVDQTTMDTYLLAVRGFNDPQLAAATADLIAGAERFPTPRELRLSLQAHETPYQTYRRESDTFTRQCCVHGLSRQNWTPELYAYHCRRLGVPPNRGHADAYEGDQTPATWEAEQAGFRGEMDA